MVNKYGWVNTNDMKFYLMQYKWYRKWKGGIWYKHQFTEDAGWICVLTAIRSSKI